MVKIRLPEKMKITAIALGVLFAMLFGQTGIDSTSADSIKVSINDLESKVISTLMFGGSNPVSFSGEGRLKLQYHDFRTCPDYARTDRSWTQSNWEGNEDMIRIGMVVRANRSTILWSKIGFQNTLPGIYTNADADVLSDGSVRRQTRHDKLEETATIHEDMCAGLAIRSVPASFWFKMGSILWTEASPFTIWKAQPRNVAWDFLPYEIEQPIARYYDYNIAKGAKEGRASWHKKALQGINLESITLPWDLYFNAIYGIYERYDSGEREYIDWTNDLAYTGDQTEAKQRGIGDSYHHVFHLRVAKSKLLTGLTFGINFLSYDVQDDIITNFYFKRTFQDTKDSMFYKEPKIASIDVKGPINNRLELQADVAISAIDTTFHKVYPDSIKPGRPSKAPISPAFFCHVKGAYGVPASIDLAFISKGFYSPLSFAAPVDAFYPFGANLLGAGKFIGRGEASPYAQNMAGAVIGIAPDIGYGHLKFMYGQHFQVEKARDLIFFPYRLNGQDFYSLFTSSYNRWDQGLFDFPLPATYQKRLGDESYHFASYKNPVGPDGGGMRFDYLSVRDGFVPYETAEDALANYREKTTIYTRSQYVPHHRKYTFNLETDIAYDLNKIFHYGKDLFLSFYGALNGVSTKPTPIAFSQKNQLLWSLYFRFEPAIALSNKFYLIGLAGYENWRADKTWMYLNNTVVSSPIDFRDVAFGSGFDWEMASRTGLHVRLKWMRHKDINYPKNDWATPVISTEIKMWY